MVATIPSPMRWHCLQHVPFEGPAQLATWVRRRGHVLTSTRLWQEAAFPGPDQYDGLFILGGPMNVYQEAKYPWLAPEKEFIAQAISQRKPILGVCLGAQLLSLVLGGTVVENDEPEIGWFPVYLQPAGRDLILFRHFPDWFMAFHWHADTFSIPTRAALIASSEACDNQAFVYEGHAIGLQFHLESDMTSVAALIEHCGDDLCCGRYIQDPYAIQDCGDHLIPAHRLLFALLDQLSDERATDHPYHPVERAEASGS
jgi:GMP synthase-like glutamine amidotransferase